MKLSAKYLSLVLAFMASAACAQTLQVATGTPAFGAYGGGPFDTVNLGNLNVHFAVPILNKAGRGVPFSYSLAYDSSIWVPVTTSGVTQWMPVGNWGWNAQTAAVSGYLTDTYTVTTQQEGCTVTTDTWSNYIFHDPLGRSHPFSGSTWSRYGSCLHPPTSFSGNLTGYATDGSGFSINANEAVGKVTSPSGAIMGGPTNVQNGAGTYTDANGNEITVNTSGQYFDTLSSTTPVLTVAGSGTPSSPSTYTYTSPSGGSPAYTVNYTQYTVATDFGFTGTPTIHEYGPTSVALISSITLPDGTSYALTYEQTPGSCTPLGGTYPTNCITGRIVGVTLPTGGSITYSYTGGTHSTGIFSDGSTSGLDRTLSPGGSWTYARTTPTGTPGPGSTWTTTITDPAGNQTVSNFAEDSTANGTSTVATYTPYETQRQLYEGSISSPNLLATIVWCYNANYSGCSTATSVSSPISQTDTYTQLPGGQTNLSEIFYNGSYTGSGLVSLDNEYDFGVSQGSAPGTSHLIRQTTISYASLGNGINGNPSSVVVSDWSSGSAVTVSSASYSYDQTAVTATSGTPQQVSITGSRGNLTTLAQEASGSTTLYNTFTYYDTGNVYISTGLSTSSSSPGPTTTYSYGSGSCGNSFVTSVSEPLSLGRSMTWNCTGGVETQVTDENSQTVTTNFTDPYYWRPANVYDQESNETTVAYSGETAAESKLLFNSSNSVSDIRSTVDGFGRPILNQRLQGPSASNYDTTETDYNNVGLPTRSTMPFSASAGGTNSSAPALATTYDALGRPLTVEDNDGGETSYTYTNNDVLVTVSGTQSFKKQLEYDGLGRLASVCEISTTLPGVGTCSQITTQTGYWTKYTYDALGRMLTVTQNAQASSGHQTRSYSYDLLGRLVSESNPETGNSGSNGTTAYTYDAACGSYSASSGDMTKRVDNAGNTTCYNYDALHRLTDAGYSGAAVCRHYRYDNSATPYNGGTPPSGVSVSNTLTRVKEAATDQCSYTTLLTDEWFSYSPRGELTDVYESTPHSGVYYHTTTSYWPSGALATLSGIPSTPTLYYGAGGSGLDGEGRYTQVSASSSPNPVTSATYSTSSTSNPLGALTGVTYGSSDSDAFTYDANTGRPLTYSFAVNGSTHTDAGSLTWNTNGTLGSLSISDSLSGTSDSGNCTFTYDDLARTSASSGSGACGSSGWQQSFSYDAFGNIKKSGSLSFTPSYTSATNQYTLSGITVSYDGDGNMLTDNLNTYTWNPNWGTMSSVYNGTVTVTATYDALGRVVEQGTGSSYAEILYSPVGKTALMNGTTLTKAFVALPGGGTAIYNSSGLAYYRHADWLGSSRLTSTQARGVYSTTAYAPFGEQYATSGTADPSFTGQNSDTVSSLYDFTFRRLSPSQGRWISPDPSGMAAVDPTTPQTWNRYAYVANDPLSFIDPLGLDGFFIANGCLYYSYSVNLSDAPGTYQIATANMLIVCANGLSGLNVSTGPNGAPLVGGAGGGSSGSGNGGASSLNNIAKKVCSTLPSGTVASVSGSGNYVGTSGSLDLVTNLRTGEVTGFFSPGYFAGVTTAGVAASGGYAFGNLGSGNSNFAGGFTGAFGGVGLITGSVATSSGGPASPSSGINPTAPGHVTTVSLGVQTPGRGFAVTSTYSLPTQLGSFWTLADPVTAIMYAANKLCAAAGK